MTTAGASEDGPWIDQIIRDAFDVIGLTRSTLSTATHLYARLPSRELPASELLVEPTGPGLEMEVILGPLADTDAAQLRQLCLEWLELRYPIEVEAIYLPGGLHARAQAVYQWPRRGGDADYMVRAVAARISDFVADVRRFSRAVLRAQVSVPVGPRPERFARADLFPRLPKEATVSCVAWTDADELLAGDSDGIVRVFARTSDGRFDVRETYRVDGTIVCLAFDSVNGRTAVGTSQSLVVVERDSTLVQIQTGVYVTDVDWDATTGDLVAALDFGRSMPDAIEGFLPVWDSRPVVTWPHDTIGQNTPPAASVDPEDFGAHCVASIGQGTVAVGTTMWESGRVETYRTSDLTTTPGRAGRFLSKWGGVDSLAFHPVEGLAVDDNEWVAVWRAPIDLRQPCDQLAYLGRRGITGLAWAPDGHLAVGTTDGHVVIWAPGQVGNQHAPAHGAHLASPITDLAWSPSGELAVATAEAGLQLLRRNVR